MNWEITGNSNKKDELKISAEYNKETGVLIKEGGPKIITDFLSVIASVLWLVQINYSGLIWKNLSPLIIGRVHMYPFLIFLWFSTITVKFYTIKGHKIPISHRSNCLYFMGKVDEATWHWSNDLTVWNDFAIISMFCGVSLYTKLAGSRRRTPIYLLLSAWKALWIVNII